MLIAVTCALFVAMRIAGAHLHLCLDGSEPPVSLHVADAGDHHVGEHLATTPHEDQDVAIGADLVAKKLFGDLELPLLAMALGLLLFVVPRRRDGRPNYPAPLLPLPTHSRLRPPLRGPPPPLTTD